MLSLLVEGWFFVVVVAGAVSRWASRGQCRPGPVQQDPLTEDSDEPLPAHYTHRGDHDSSQGAQGGVTLNAHERERSQWWEVELRWRVLVLVLVLVVVI